MAGESENLDQDDIEALLNQDAAGSPADAGESSEGAAAAGPSSPEAPSVVSPAIQSAVGDSAVTQSDIELLLNKAEQALDSIDQVDQGQSPLPAGIKSFEFKPFSGTAANKEAATLELMSDVQLDMTIELGRTHMELEDVLKLKQGSVVPLDKLAGDPADIYVNGRLVARGEVLVLNDNFCIRVAELVVGESACA